MDALMLPLNWQRVRLGDILTLKHGRDYKNFKLGNIPVYGSGGYMLSINNFLHNGESVCIGRKGTIDKPIYLNGKFWVVDTLFYSYSFKKSIPKFIFYAFSIIKWSNYNEATGVPSLTKMTISNIEIPLPPLNEQSAIANILSGLDYYLHALNSLILKKEGVKKALSFELLSQRKRLKGFNQAWQRVRLGDICEIKRGASPRPIENPKWFCANSNVGWVRISDISKNSRFLYKTAQKLSKKGIEKSRFIKQNSLIMSMCATIGKPIITKIDTCIHDGFVVFENPKIDLNYLYYFLCYIEKEWLESGQQGSQVNLNVDLIKNKEVFCPKDLNEQIAIANILSDLDHEIISLKNKKRQFDNIKKALNHDLMSAKIRVLKK